MKVLIVCSRIPYPLKDGGAIATFQMIRELSGLGHEVTVLSLNTKKHFVHQELVEKVFIGLANVIQVPIDTSIKITKAFTNLWSNKSYNIQRFRSKAFAERLRMECALHDYDVIQFEGLFVAPYVKETLGTRAIKSLRQHNVEHQIWEGLAAQEKSGVKKKYLRLLAKRMKREELELIPQFDAVVSISPLDSMFFEKHTFKPVLTCPLGVEWKGFPSVSNLKVYHIGSMEWMPNLEGVEWFLSQVWPLVLEKEPEACFYLAGKGLSKSMFKDFKNVQIDGEVPEVEEYAKDKSLLIVPIFSGSGVRVKILEALSLGKKVVSTSQGIQGMMPGHQIPTTDAPQEFAEAVVHQFHASECAWIPEYLKTHYNTQELIAQLDSFYNSLLRSRKI